MISPRLSPALVLAACVAALGGAFFFQYVVGLAPCVLCIYERYPYALAIVLSLAALLIADPRLRGAGLALCGAAFLVGAGIGVFHVGVEQHWWEGTAACTGSASQGAARSLDALRQQILSSHVARCDRVPWSLFGISLAGYNVLISLGLMLYAFAAARHIWTGNRG